MNTVHQLMCPHCQTFTKLPKGEEPREGVMYHCDSGCQTSFKLVAVGGTFLTANAGDNEDEVRRLFAGMEGLVKPAQESLTLSKLMGGRVPLDIFDLINVGKNRGAKVIFDSNPEGDNWLKRIFMDAEGDGTWRRELPEAELLACPCEDCKEELERRRKNQCAAPDAPADCPAQTFADGHTFNFGGAPEDRVPSVPELMAEAAETFRQRNELYGDSYKHFHEHMMTLFPDGLTLKTADDWRRFGILFYAIGKLVRYANNFGTGGHIDSAHDLGVYAFMLEEVSRMGLKERGL